MLIGISGKLNSGKDTVADMIKYLTSGAKESGVKFEDWKGKLYGVKNDMKTYPFISWQTKRFADKLKDIVCLLLGCTREELEDREFKEKELGKEWWYYTNTLFNTEDKELVPYLESNKFIHNSTKWYIIKMTPRLLMQLMGTEYGRQTIYPNIWVNALMSEYKPVVSFMCDNCMEEDILKIEKEDTCPLCQYEREGNLTTVFNDEGSQWIIPDTRFLNEAEAIKKRGGLLIRIERPTHKYVGKSIHPSEIALDNYSDWDYTITNTGTIDDLLDKVEVILRKEGIL